MDTNMKLFDLLVTRDHIESGGCIDSMITKLRPDWPPREIRQRTLAGGFLNWLVLFYHEDGDDSIVVRLFDIDRTPESMDRTREVISVQMAASAGCSPQVLGIFKNGLIYKYEPGRIMDPGEFKDPHYIRKMARLICTFHHADLQKSHIVDSTGARVAYDTTTTFYDDMRIIIKSKSEELAPEGSLRDRLAKINVTRTMLLAEIDYMESFLADVDLPLVLVHNDFHHRNIITNDSTGKTFLMDYELCCIGYAAIDIEKIFHAQDFRIYIPGFYDDPRALTPFTEEIQRLWAKEYVTRKYEICGRDVQDVDDHVIEAQYREHKLVAAVTRLLWMVIMIDYSSLPGLAFVDFASCIEVVFLQYQRTKAGLPQVKMDYINAIHNLKK